MKKCLYGKSFRIKLLIITFSDEHRLIWSHPQENRELLLFDESIYRKRLL
jgi:hypothetical protein